MNKKKARLRRAARTRFQIKKLHLIRLVVHRTSKHIYAQIIDSKNALVLTSASTVEKEILNLVKYTGNIHASICIGKKIAERALMKGIINVSFDRSGFQYHGRVKALADAARESGLKF
ncbi:50S ribosomal protein L18 [Buchnera aphidicola]|uniref:50S ribosomal protein L18 n=1 Tax=Buchnera aphidicola TaxID=9 RepID=UPI0005C4648C|nr:50S ribosomal protein L18 [Buchnera aphidicola]